MGYFSLNCHESSVESRIAPIGYPFSRSLTSTFLNILLRAPLSSGYPHPISLPSPTDWAITSTLLNNLTIVPTAITSKLETLSSLIVNHTRIPRFNRFIAWRLRPLCSNHARRISFCYHRPAVSKILPEIILSSVWMPTPSQKEFKKVPNWIALGCQLWWRLRTVPTFSSHPSSSRRAIIHFITQQWFHRFQLG